ncbi:MAG: Na/Pi symporter, partial [Gemmatimonadales bacterium]|nr:Na/Pi symporter [Gemmatimonadales bacterium]
MTTATRPDAPESTSKFTTPIRILLLLGLLFVFLVGVKAMGDGFKMLGKDVLDTFFAATENPFMGLIVGVLATTLVQSSSVTTSMIVGLVASPENPLPLANAVPMIMGANIGTTVTNSIVSLAHMARRDEFRRAFSVATVHDFFNVMAVALLLPVEMVTGFLQKTAGFFVSTVSGLTGAQYESPIRGAISQGVRPIKEFVAVLFDSAQGQGILLVLISGALIFLALFALVRVMRSAMMTRVEIYVSRFVSAPALIAIAVGVVVTVMVQSSSITTSLLVPLAGAGLITAQQAFPLTIGANLGTTVTALLASLAVSGAHAEAGIHIALVHLLFNLTATAIIFPIRRVRRIPVAGSEWIAGVATHSRRWALVY